jgi:hypothetical protein
MATLEEMRRESRVRARARRAGYYVQKSRQRNYVPNLNNQGQYMLVNDRNRIVLGERFDATLDDIEAYLREHAAA